MYKISQAFFLLILFSSSANAVTADTNSYYRAYNLCSPAAQKQTMQQCGYSRLVEGYYTSCMAQKGFGDANAEMDKNRYDEYLRVYRECSVVANSAAQKECNYNIVYRNYYNNCMATYGFDSNGESTRSQAEPEKKEDDIPNIIKKDPTSRNPTGKMLDGMF